jgi:Domain of unknown function (DUF4278)
MELHFHGATYEYNPTLVETIETEITAQFRGIEYQIRHLKKPLPQAKKQLIYRGIPY